MTNTMEDLTRHVASHSGIKVVFLFCFFFKILFTYLRETESEHKQGEGQEGKEQQTAC